MGILRVQQRPWQGRLRRLPCLRYGSHYLEVEICHWWTLLSANPKFSGWKKLWKSEKKLQKLRSACVGQADLGKLELNNIGKDSGNSQRLSVVNVINLKEKIWNKCGWMFRPSPLRRLTRELLSLAILRLLRKHSNKQTNKYSIFGGRESWNAG